MMLRKLLLVLAVRGTTVFASAGAGHANAVLLPDADDLPRSNAQLQLSRGAITGSVPSEESRIEVGVPGVITARRRRRSLPLKQLQHMATACNGSVFTAAGAPCHPSQGQLQTQHQKKEPKLHPVAQFALGTGEFAFHLSPSSLATAPVPAVLGTAKQPADFLEPNRAILGGLLLELHLPGATLQQLHNSAHGSLAQFLRGLHSALSTAAHIEPRQITILGIHGRYRRVDPESTETGFGSMPQRVDEEVLVKFEVVPLRNGGAGTEPQALSNEASLIASLQQGLASQRSAIMHGALGTIIKNATITRALAAGISEIPQEVRSEGPAQLSAIFLPIGVSAAFTGVLIWLAAW